MPSFARASITPKFPSAVAPAETGDHHAAAASSSECFPGKWAPRTCRWGIPRKREAGGGGAVWSCITEAERHSWYQTRHTCDFVFSERRSQLFLCSYQTLVVITLATTTSAKAQNVNSTSLPPIFTENPTWKYPASVHGPHLHRATRNYPGTAARWHFRRDQAPLPVLLPKGETVNWLLSTFSISL
jgi:hypothetical protein